MKETVAASGRGRRREGLAPSVRAWCCWFAPLFLLCLGWTLATPRFASPDEGQHLFEAAALARGQFFPPDRKTEIAYLGEVRIAGTYNNMSVASACFTAKAEQNAECGNTFLVDRTPQPALTVVTRYPPLYYLMLAPVARVLPPIQAIYAMRLITMVVGTSLLAVAFVTAQSLGRWAVLGVAAATTPVVVYLTSVVNPSGLELSSAVALWALMSALARRPTVDRGLVAGAAISFALFAHARPFSLAFAAAALFLPVAMVGRRRAQALAADPTVRRWGLFVGVAGCAAVLWRLFRGHVSAIHGGATAFTLWDGIERTWTLLQESVARFGLGEVQSLLAVLIWLALWATLLVLALRRGTKRDRLVLGGLLLVGVAVPIALSFLAPPPIYRRFHGRYILPLWAGLPILSGVVASRGRDVVTRFSRRGWALVGVLIAAGHLVAFATAARRYSVGTHGAIAYLVDPEWTGPVPPLLPIMLAAAGAVWLAVRVTTAGAAPVAATTALAADPVDVSR